MSKWITKIGVILGAVVIFIFMIPVFAPTVETHLIKNLEIKKENKTEILFAGDIMLDRHIRKQARNWGYEHFFECIKDEFKNKDFVVANLESTITDYTSVSEGEPQEDPNHYRFTADPISLSALKSAGINILGLANNHIFDFGRGGIFLTRKNLEEADLNFFGDPLGGEFQTFKIEHNDNIIFLIPFNQFFGSEEETIQDIKNIKQNYVEKEKNIIIFAHWGDEYVKANDFQKKLARKFIDAGADMIIGMHPHVIQETEYYKDKFIAYSLGNFVFDQYFDEEVKKGMVVEVVIEENKIKKITTRKTFLNPDRQVCLE